tara:strand:- start:56889 stop:57785 length:897 start_codon:yes stop_codon:yes gene_type:complete
MQKTLSIRSVSFPLLALLGALTSCATPTKMRSGWATEPASFEASTAASSGAVSRPQDMMPDLSQIHPKTMITLGAAFGDQTLEVNNGTGILARSTSAQRFRLRAEHYFESGLGLFFEGYTGTADDIDDDLMIVGNPSSSLDSSGFFLAAAYRATVDDDFRLPVRFGPFIQTTDQDNSLFADGAIERQTIGIRLSAEPEVILMQSNRNGKISEFTAFGEVRAGAGPTDVKDNVDSEEGYSFTIDYEFGLRYKFGFGLLTSLSWVGSKYHVGATESYNNTVFFGLDDDFRGLMLTAGFRF